jgi:hypothetical protein
MSPPPPDDRPAPQRRAAGGDIMKMFEGPTEESLDEQQRELVRRGREVFTELEKLLKNVGLYGQSHQSIDRFRQRFLQAITGLLADREQVEIKVGPYDFLICEQSVYQNQTPEKNFVYRFFQDGIRALRFEQGIEPEEMDAFVDILLTNWEDPALFEDDAVTLLWQRDFRHIRYKVIESFSEEVERTGGEYTVDGVIDRVRQGADESVGIAGPSLTPDPDDIVFTGDDALGGRGGGQKGRGVLGKALLTEADLAAFQEHPFAMDELEFATLKQVHEASQRETLEKFIEILFKVCLAEQNLAERERLTGYFGRIAGLLLEGGRVLDLKRVLLKLRSLTGPDGELILENIEFINAIFERWSTPELVAELMRFFDDPRFEHPGAILEICRLLNPSASVHMAREAGRINSSDRRQALFEMLGDLIGGHIKEVGRLLQSVNQAHAHDLLRILRRFDHPDVQSAISAALANPDAAVRLEALSAIPVERAHVHLRFIQAALSDSSKVVRSKALHLLAQMRRPEVHSYLMQRLREKDFAQLELDEKRKYFAVAALSGDPTEYFMELLTSRGLFKRGASDDLRACAAVGLGVRMHREAIPHLQNEATKRLGNDIVREACTWALLHMASDREERRRQFYDLFFRGELSAPRGNAT